MLAKFNTIMQLNLKNEQLFRAVNNISNLRKGHVFTSPSRKMLAANVISDWS